MHRALAKQHARPLHRRVWRVVHVGLAIGAFAILAMSLPSQRPEGAVLALAGEASRDGVTSDVAKTAVNRSSYPLAPILERMSLTANPGRPVIRVAQPSPGVVLRGTTGAKAVFLGDSYTTGWHGAGIGSRGWPRLVGRALGWQTVNLAVAGTGFINPGWTNQPVGALVAAAVRQKPDIVVIAAGHNDSRWSATATAQAADNVIDRLRTALPRARLVVLAPIWPNAGPPMRCLYLRDRLRRKAASVDAVFIDPLAEGWFAGSRSLIMSDGIHPTDAGHRRIAQRVLANLARVS